jgi:parallel beta-helix repeat protein
MNKRFRAIAKRLFSVSVMVLFLLPCVVLAATIRVPADQPTIQVGINVAVDGDTVLVADGTYNNQDVNFKGKAITVQSEDGAANCIIAGFNFWTGESQTSVLKGVTITSGISCDDSSSPTITGCTFTGSVVSAIWCRTASSPTITDCTFTGNGSNAIYCSDASSPTITGCTISGNGTYGISCRSSSPTISDCTITGNEWHGISCDDSSSPTISNCTVSGNKMYGISCYSGSPTITNCTISGNEGYGIYCSSGSPIIRGCTVSGNRRTGIYCSSASPNIEKCIIRDNLTTGSGGGLRFSSCIEPRLTNCLIVGNTAYNSTGGIESFSSSLAITNCTISGNTANATGGVSISNGFPTVKNTVIYGNTPNTNNINTNVTVDYSDIAGYSGTGTGNIDEAPLFEGSSDYHLSAGSPCIDTGTSSGAPNTDIDGSSRPKGHGYDMGAYEFTPIAFVNMNDKTCDGNTPCYTSIQTAISTEGIGSEINVAEGSYTEAINLNDSISTILKGGWNSAFTSQTSGKTFIKAPKVSQGSLTMQMLTIKP